MAGQICTAARARVGSTGLQMGPRSCDRPAGRRRSQGAQGHAGLPRALDGLLARIRTAARGPVFRGGDRRELGLVSRPRFHLVCTQLSFGLTRPDSSITASQRSAGGIVALAAGRSSGCLCGVFGSRDTGIS